MAQNDEAPIPENPGNIDFAGGLLDMTGRLRSVHLYYGLLPLLLLLILLVPVSMFLLRSRLLTTLSVFLAILFLSYLLFILLVWTWIGKRQVGKLALGIVAALNVLSALLAFRARGIVLLSGGLFLALLIFPIALFLVGGKLLPFSPPPPGATRRERLRHWFSNHWEAMKILLDWTSGINRPIWVITREPREEDRIEERLPGDPLAQFATGHGAILTDCDMAVAVSTGMKFKGVLGPGLILTDFADRPMQTVDLRPQLRAFWVHAMTRDGIQVKVLAFTPFQIDRGDQQPRLGEPFPFRRSAAFKAIHAQMQMLPETAEKRSHLSWDMLPSLLGTRILQDILSRYRFDDLYAPHGLGEEPPRVAIARQFRERLRVELEPLGIQLLGGGISNILPVREEVLKERVRNWQAEWVRQILIRQAEGQKERLWRIEQARAEAQAELIMALGQRLTELERSDSPVSPEDVVREFLRVLEEMAQQPMMRRYLPREMAEEARRLRMEQE